MRPVNGAREHLDRQEVRVRALLRQLSAGALLVPSQLLLGKRWMQQHVGRQIEQRIDLIAQTGSGHRSLLAGHTCTDGEARGHHLELL